MMTNNTQQNIEHTSSRGGLLRTTLQNKQNGQNNSIRGNEHRKEAFFPNRTTRANQIIKRENLQQIKVA